jgi:hypothetical protein
MAVLPFFLIACGGSGNQDPILGMPSLTSVSTAPIVVLTTPAKTVPAMAGVATNIKLTAKFNRDMKATSLDASSFKVACPAGSPVTGTVTYDAVNRLAILQHAANFPISTTCTATVTTGAKDTAGVALASDYVWSFTTSAAADTTAPTVTANSPANNATGVCLSKSVSVTFSEAMDPSTISASTFFITNPANAVILGGITYDTLSHTATFAITNPPGFVASTLYTSHVTIGATDLAGNALNAPNIVSFTTGTVACAPAATVALGSIASYGAFGGGAGATNSGVNTVVNGDLGTTAACTLFTGFHDASNTYTEVVFSNIGQVTGNIYCAPPAPGTTLKLALATQAAADALTAYNALAAKTPTVILGPGSGELGGLTVAPGTYRPTASTFILSTGNLTLDAGGDSAAIWVFQVPASLTVGLSATPRSVLLINGAQAKNVFWQVGSAARIEDGSSMVGTIIASAGVTISTAGQTIQTTLTGRAIGLNASVTMVNTTIVAP